MKGMSVIEKRRKFYRKLRKMVQDFCVLVQAVDKKIDELTVHSISNEEHNHLVNNLRHEIFELKKYQDNLKSEFMEIKTEFCGMESGEVHKTVEEMKTAMERIREFGKEEQGVIQKLDEWSSVFQEKEKGSESELLRLCRKHEMEVVLDSLGLENFDGEWGLPEMTTKIYQLPTRRTNTEDELLYEFEAVILSHLKDMKDQTKKFLMDERQRGERKKLQVFLQGFKEMISENLDVLDCKERVVKAEKLIVNWLLEVEVEIFLLVNDFISLISSNKEAVFKFRGYKLNFEELKRSKCGRVPIMVYCLLALLGREIETVKDSETEFLFGEIHGRVDQIMDRVYKMITSDIMFVTNVLGMPSSHLNKKEALLVATEVLKHCDKELKSSQSEIKEVMEA